MRTLKITLAYDGTRFVGWQRQAEGDSIQGLVEDALAQLEGAPVAVHGAGRTDAGVHALGQVASASVSFTHSVDTVVRALNARLPADIRVLEVADAAAEFHARFSARSKTYRYQLRTGCVGDPFTRAFTWQMPESLDVDAMRTAAGLLVGRHDFAAFQSAGTDTNSTVRTIFRSEIRGPDQPSRFALRRSAEALAEAEGSAPLTIESAPLAPLVFEVTGDGFLRHMVRAIVGTLVEIGRGWRSVESMTQLLSGGTRAQAGATAPPHGLFLVRVDYD